MSLEIANAIHAAMQLDAANPPVILMNRGFVNIIGAGGVVRNGAGDYTLNLDVPIAQGESLVICTCLDAAAPGSVRVVRPAAGSIQVLTTDIAAGPALADRDFGLVVLRMPQVG